jgi:predicted TIM-barrel fold metal-dependent hydrolase
MNEAGIDYSLLIADGAVEGTYGVIKICEENPRLKAIGNVDYKTIGEEQISNLIDLLKIKKMHGVKLYPGYQDFYPLDEKLFPLYEAAQILGKTVIFHTGSLMKGFPGLLKQVQPLNIDDVANKFPDLKIVMAHFGNPWVVDTATVMYKNKNVYVDLSGYFETFRPIPKKDIEYFVQDITYIKNWVGDLKRCLFGTDWPLYSQKEYLEAVRQLPLSDEEKELVFWKNAKELFDLDI